MDIKDGLSTLATIEVLSEKKFEKWYIFNRLPDNLKEIIIPSYEKFCKEQKILQIINLIISILCVVFAHMLYLKDFNFGLVFSLYIMVWLLSWIAIFLITIGTHNIINRNKPYPICHRWIKKNAIKVVLRLPDCEQREKELLKKLEKEINKKRK